MKPFWMARLAGTQEEMGAQHGALAPDDAARLMAFYRTMPERLLGGDLRGLAGGVGRAVIRAVATAWQARLVRERPRELAARSRAFAEAVRAAGKSVPGDALLALATMDSMQNTVSLAARGRFGPFAGPPRSEPTRLLRALLGRARVAAVPACSSAIAWGASTTDGELIFGRNFDFPGVGVWDVAPAFVACAPDRGQRYGFFTTRGADTPVVTVVNEAGLVFAPHTRWHRGVTFGGAMIVDLVHELARRAESLDDAIRIARERPISSSWGIAIGSARERAGLVLEIAGPTVEVVRPAPGASFVVCANRYRTPALQAGQVAGSEAWALHSERRERRLHALVEHAVLSPEVLARFLGDRHDIDAPARRRHLGAILAQAQNVHCAVVTPAHRRALVGIDRAPACEGTWAELAWSWDGPPGGWELGTTPLAAGGFTARTRTDIAAPHDAATRHVYEAARAYEHAHDVPAAFAALERAALADPDDPSLRLPAAWLALEAEKADRAVVHVHAGLLHETDTYRRTQLLVWGARAARRVAPAMARTWTDELTRLGEHELAAAAKKPFRGRPRVNLMMADAY